MAEIDAWRNICIKSDVIKTLKFLWDPRCDSLREDKVKEFFDDIRNQNTSIESISVSMFHGEVKQSTHPLYHEETEYLQAEVKQLAEHVVRCLRKENLKVFTIELQIIQPSIESSSDYVKTVIHNIIEVFQVRFVDDCSYINCLNHAISGQSWRHEVKGTVSEKGEISV